MDTAANEFSRGITKLICCGVQLHQKVQSAKNTLLATKAIELAQKKEKVLFLIDASRFFNCHRLLELQLAIKFADFQDFIVIEPIDLLFKKKQKPPSGKLIFGCGVLRDLMKLMIYSAGNKLQHFFTNFIHVQPI